MAGSGAVGKTSLLMVLKNGKSLQELGNNTLEYHRTPFLEIDAFKVLNEGGNLEHSYLIYDISGQLNLPVHALKELKQLTLGGVDIIFLIFANNNLQSLLDLKEWLKIIESSSDINEKDLSKPPYYVLIKNKIDLESNIDEALVKMVLENEPRIIKYFEVSCKTGEGIPELMTWLKENKVFWK